MRFSFLILVLSLITNVYAFESFSYSGRLVNSNGSPVGGYAKLTFELAYSKNVGAILCVQNIDNVALSNGVFHVELTFPDCNLIEVIKKTPVGQTLSIRVIDKTQAAEKAYSFQAIHSLPYSVVSETSKQLDQMEATPGQVLSWEDGKWKPKTINTEIADGSVTDIMLQGNIPRSKLASGDPNQIVVNDASGNLSSINVAPLSLGGTGATTPSDARANIGAMAISDVPLCHLPHQKLQMGPGPVYWSCVQDEVSDNTKLPLAGGTLSGPLILAANPTEQFEAATKDYVDSQINGMHASPWQTGLDNGIYFNSANVGIGTNTPEGILDIQSTSSGILIPRMNTSQRAAIVSPAPGMQIYNIQTNELNFFNGTEWKALGVSGSGIGSITAGDGLLGGTISSSGTISVDVGTEANQIVQLDGSSQLPAVSGNLLTNLNPSALSTSVPLNKGGTGLASGGAGNTILGMNALGTGAEYKTITATLPLVLNHGIGNVGLELSAVPISKGGTGLTSFDSDRLYSANSAGQLTPFLCLPGYVLSFDIIGRPECLDTAGYFIQGGNNFSSAAVLGTNNNQSLNFETNNNIHMTILPDGNVGIGTAEPNATLDVGGRLHAFEICDETGANCKDISTGWGAAAGSGFGSWELRSFSTNYQAPTDGFVVAWGSSAYLVGYTDSASTPTIKRVESEGAITNAGRPALIMPVKKDDYWRVQLVSGSAGEVSWIPLAGPDTGIWSMNGTNTYKLTGNIGIGVNNPEAKLHIKGAIRLSGSTSGYTGFAPAANAGSTVWTLPSNDGLDGQVLKTDGSGKLSWVNNDGLASGTVAQFLRGDKTWQALNTTAVIESGANVYFSDERARNAVLTGYVSGVPMPVASSDSIIQALAKLEAQNNKTKDDYVPKSGATMTGALNLPSNGLKVGSNEIVVSGSKVGIGTDSPQATLHVEGTVKIADGSEQAGYTLTSDVSGNANWQKPKTWGQVCSAGYYLMGYDNNGNIVCGSTLVTFSGAAQSGGGSHQCAIMSDSTVACWGYNAAGQLGNNTTAMQTIGTFVRKADGSKLSSVTSLALSWLNSCAVSSGEVYCWGDNAYYQGGIGTTADTWLATKVPTIINAVDVASGLYHTCARLADGRVMCWGLNDNGQIGNNTLTTQKTPVFVLSETGVGHLTGVTELTAGTKHNCVIKSGGVYCWGDNAYGTLGDGTTGDKRIPVATLNMASGVSTVAASLAYYNNGTTTYWYSHSCAIKTDSSVWCWGRCNYSQCGYKASPAANITNPVKVLLDQNKDNTAEGPLLGAVSLSLGALISCAVMGDTTLKCWGTNGNSAVAGDGTTTTRPFAIPVAGIGNVGELSNVKGVSITGQYNNGAGVSVMAVLNDGNAVGWGANGRGQVGDNSTTARLTPVGLVQP